MSKFFIGAVVEMVETDRLNGKGREAIGREGTIISVSLSALHDWRVKDSTGALWDCVERALRLKRPPTKDGAEPRTDFQPCDEDFSEWMKKLGRVGA